VQNADPHGAALARLFHIQPEDASAWYGLLISLALEFGGMACIMAAEIDLAREARERTTPCVPEVVAAPPVITEAKNVLPMRAPSQLPGSVAAFMAECLPRVAGAEADSGAVYVAYKAWCAQQSPPALPHTPAEFGRRFAVECRRVGIKTRSEGKSVRCVGVRLAVA
jgi:hypothetical protein